MLAREIMSRPVAFCRTSDTLNQAAKLMWEGDCGVIPVVDSEGRAVAVLTDRDVCMAAYTQGKRLREINVCAAMSKGLVACSPDDSLERVEELMAGHQIRRLPVLDDEGRPIGIVSLNDLARALGQELAAAPIGRREPQLTGMSRALAAICAPQLRDAGPRLM